MTDTYPDAALVSPDWVADRLDRATADDPALQIVEVDVDTDRYECGHIPGAVCLDWRRDLRATDSHDIVGPDAMARLLGDCGITEETTVVVYGDEANWFATHFYWQLTHYGHPDVRVVDGGRDHWVEQGYPTSTAPVSPPTRSYGRSLSPPARPAVRASRVDVSAAIDDETVLVDVRLDTEFRGERTAPPGTAESAVRGGHVPGARNVLWAANLRPDRRFKSPAALRSLYADHGITADETVIAYCRIGERSSITWFALSELLGFDRVANYDGSWTEWGNLVGVPIETGSASR